MGNAQITNGQRTWIGDIPMKVSNSEIQTFKDCRRKWWFAYYRELGLNRDNTEVTGPRSLGTRVHLALEGMYTRDENPLEIIHEIYELAKNQMLEDGRADAAAAIEKEYDLAYIMIEGYLQWVEENGIDDGIEVVGVEEIVEVPFTPIPGVMLRAKLDQRVVRKVDNARLFRDFKTVADLTTPPKTLPMDEQMKFYQLLEYLQSINETGGEPQWRTDGALYTMLRKVKRTANAKPPFYDQLEVQHNIAEIRNMYSRVAKVVEEIFDARHALDEGIDHQYQVPPRPSRDCTWKCDFFPVCSMVDDGSDYESMLKEWYTHLDPHERYNTEEQKGES